MASMQTVSESGSAQASEFGSLLREWRTLRKLSQLELSLLTGVSQRHLSFLESGRSGPGRDMVMTLALALELPLRERNRFLLTAGFAPVYQARSLDQPAMAQVKRALEWTLKHHDPFPAIVVDYQWNLVMHNQAAHSLFSLLDDPARLWQRISGEQTPNMIRAFFHPQGFRPYVENWQDVGPLLLNRLQREASTKPDAGIAQLLAELQTLSDVPAAWLQPNWHDPLTPVCPLFIRKGDLRINLFSMLSLFGTPQDITVDELRIETMFPGDEATERLFRQLGHNT